MLVMVGAARLPGIDQQTSTNSLVTLLSATPVMRVIARIDDPSQSIDRIWARWAIESLFMPGMTAAHACPVKNYSSIYRLDGP
jgi:hypothetical protein